MRPTQRKSLLLDEQICFQLYLASKNMTKAYSPLLERIGLTYPQYLVMLVLWEHKKLSIKEIGKKLQLDSGTLSPLIKRMMQKGLTSKAKNMQDERGVKIALTKEGIALKAMAQCVPMELSEAIPFERAKLSALLKTLKEFNAALGSLNPAL